MGKKCYSKLEEGRHILFSVEKFSKTEVWTNVEYRKLSSNELIDLAKQNSRLNAENIN